MQWTL